MSGRHNIVGSEATGRHRLVAFSHAHGSIRELPRPRVRGLGELVLAFAAGVIATLAALALLLQTGA